MSIPIFVVKATLIIIYRTKDAIYVGADSRSTVYHLNSHGSIDTIYRTICKINISNNIYSAVAGFDDSMLAINAKKACVKAHNIEEAANEFQKLTQGVYKERLEYFRKKNPVGYTKRLAGNNVGSLSFFNFNNGLPRLLTVWFIITNSANQPTKFEFHTDYRDYVPLGAFHTLDDYPSDPFKNGYIKGIKTLIEYAINKRPNNINYPIDLLILTKNGPQWIQKKNTCK